MTFRHVFYIGLISTCLYAYRDWFVSLCGLILIMAVVNHENMPSTWYGIPGLNPWNILFVMVFLGWLSSRHREGLNWDMPRSVCMLLLMYMGVMLIGVLWAAAQYDPDLIHYTLRGLFFENFFNRVKWVLPGILLFCGCRNRRRLLMVIACLLTVYVLIAVQVIRAMPYYSLFDPDGLPDVRLRICKDIGYSAVDMSALLAGGSWAILAAMSLVREKKYKVLLMALAGVVFIGQAETGGRAGYIAWGGIGLVLCLLKWRKLLILVPVVLILLPIVFPSAAGRMLTGLSTTNLVGQDTFDQKAATSNRLLIWPHVIDKITESPIVGHGRLAMQTTGLERFLGNKFDEPFPHPHNMYLETLLDNGILGSLPIFMYWGMMVACSGRLFRSKNRLYSAVGGVALSLILAQLFAGIGSQHFYPDDSTMLMWAAMFLSLRVYVDEKRIRESLNLQPEY